MENVKLKTIKNLKNNKSEGIILTWNFFNIQTCHFISTSLSISNFKVKIWNLNLRSFAIYFHQCHLAYLTTILTLFRMTIFGVTHGWGRGVRSLLPEICHTYPTMMKLGTVIPCIKKTQKTYKSRDINLEFYWHQHQKSAIYVISKNTDIDC